MIHLLPYGRGGSGVTGSCGGGPAEVGIRGSFKVARSGRRLGSMTGLGFHFLTVYLWNFESRPDIVGRSFGSEAAEVRLDPGFDDLVRCPSKGYSPGQAL